jgi:hypothetical protein
MLTCKFINVFTILLFNCLENCKIYTERVGHKVCTYFSLQLLFEMFCFLTNVWGDRLINACRFSRKLVVKTVRFTRESICLNTVVMYSLPSALQLILKVLKFRILNFKTVSSFKLYVFICKISHNMFRLIFPSSGASKLYGKITALYILS